MDKDNVGFRSQVFPLSHLNTDTESRDLRVVYKPELKLIEIDLHRILLIRYDELFIEMCGPLVILRARVGIYQE